MSAESLIGSLVDDLKPVKPLRAFMVWLLALASTIAATMVMLHYYSLPPVNPNYVQHDAMAMMMDHTGMSEGLAGRLANMMFMWRAIILAVVALSLTAMVILSAKPGQKAARATTWSVIIASAAFIVSGVVAAIHDDFAGIAQESAPYCIQLILKSSIAPFLLFTWWLRRGAPVEPLRAGFLAGMAAASLGSFAFSWLCPHDEMQFGAVWYSISILGMGAFGALVTPRICRW